MPARVLGGPGKGGCGNWRPRPPLPPSKPGGSQLRVSAAAATKLASDHSTYSLGASLFCEGAPQPGCRKSASCSSCFSRLKERNCFSILTSKGRSPVQAALSSSVPLPPHDSATPCGAFRAMRSACNAEEQGCRTAQAGRQMRHLSCWHRGRRAVGRCWGMVCAVGCSTGCLYKRIVTMRAGGRSTLGWARQGEAGRWAAAPAYGSSTLKARHTWSCNCHRPKTAALPEGCWFTGCRSVCALAAACDGRHSGGRRDG